LNSLLALWDAAEPTGCVRLFFAEYETKPLAGLLCITFGKTFGLWKKGWTSTDAHLHANDLSNYEALKWASKNGYQFCDFSAFDKQIAFAMLGGEPLPPELKSSRHMFNVRFGGGPRLLPIARVYFPNPLIRSAYRVVFQKKIRQAEEECNLTAALVSNAWLDHAQG
jgi:hypothetical protein